jgi:peptide/nickel transport system permease protein
MATIHSPAVAEEKKTPRFNLGSVLLYSQRLWRNYTIRTFLQGIVTVWAVITFIFFLVRLMPGNPVQVYIDYIINQENLSYDEAYVRAASQFKFDPDANKIEQYFDYMGQLLRGDLGESITSTGTRVIDQILRYLPWTLFAVGMGLLVSFVLGVLLGILMAYYRNSPLDVALSLFSSIMSAVPNYIWGIAIILIFGVQLQWFSVGQLRGTYSPGVTPGFNLEFIRSVLEHAILPIIVYISGALGTWMLTMRNSTISVLGEDYVNVARARGLTQGRILTAYVGRNAALPMVTLLAINIGFIIGGSIIIEQLFVYNGLGNFLFRSITLRDYTSMQGVLLVIVISVVMANLLADLLYSRLDPRVQLGES